MISTERNSRRSLDSGQGSLAGLALKKCKTVTVIGGVLSRPLRVEGYSSAVEAVASVLVTAF